MLQRNHLTAGDCGPWVGGTQLLPKLLLFTANDNCLESFKGLPSLTSVQTLQLCGNPALEGRERLPTAAAMLIGESLTKFSGKVRDPRREEQLA